MQASIESTGTLQQRAHGWLTDQALLTATTVVLLVILCLPVFAANRSPLNSDQSLYLAEALNIADGDGLTYPTGKPITHRAPLYPALLAGAFKLEGTTLDAAYVVPRLSVVANVLLLFFLGRALFGAWGGAVAGITAAASLYLRGLGTTLFLDSTQVTFLLAALLVYWRAGSSVPRMACAGALLGASFLIKEASVLFLPLPVVVSLLYGFDAGWKKALPAWFAGFAAVTAWWFVWVYVQTGDLFLIGPPGGHFGLLLGAASLVVVVTFPALLRFAPAQFPANRLTLACAALVLLAWNAVFFAGMETTSWQYESNYLAHVASYLTRIFLPNVQPAPLIIAAWGWLAWSSPRSRAVGLIGAAVLLYGSFFVLVADRGLSLRDQLPVVYLSYLALGGAAAWLVNARHIRRPRRPRARAWAAVAQSPSSSRWPRLSLISGCIPLSGQGRDASRTTGTTRLSQPDRRLAGTEPRTRRRHHVFASLLQPSLFPDPRRLRDSSAADGRSGVRYFRHCSDSP